MSQSKCPICDRVLDIVHLPGMATFYGRNLPNWSPPACYAADLASIMSFYISSRIYEDLTKGLVPIKNAKESWHNDRKAISYAIALSFTAMLSKCDELVDGANTGYLKRELDRHSTDASGLVGKFEGSEGFQQLVVRSAQAIEQSIRKVSLKPRYADIDLITHLVAILQGALAGTDAYLSNYLEGKPMMAFMEATTNSPSSSRDSQRGATSPSKSNRADHEYVTGDARRDYTLWVQRCKSAIEERRLPLQHFVDLIPSFDNADHTLRDARKWKDLLDNTSPGRSNWLDSEGVTDDDVEDFWGAPVWVQNFREALVKREFEFQIGAVEQMGRSTIDSIVTALFFLPTFSIFDGTDSPTLRTSQLPQHCVQAVEPTSLVAPLPFELFTRVNRYLAGRTEREHERAMMSNEVVQTNQLIRLLVKREEV